MEGAVAGGAATPLLTLRVTVRAPDLEAFIERYSKHIDGDRIFIFTKNPQPVGTRCKFTLQLASGEQLIHGKGTVCRVQSDASDRRHPPGMELVFVPLDDRSQTLVDFLLATRAESEPPLVRAVVGNGAPPPLPPAEIGRGDVSDIHTETERAEVAVTSNPPGARVIVDGTPHAAPTPTALAALDPQKVYEVQILLDGHRPFTRKIRPKAGDKLHALLFPLERVVEVRGQPPGAEVLIDGKHAGATPLTVKRLERGKDHLLEVRKDGFASFRRRLGNGEFALRGEREVLDINVELQPATESDEATDVEDAPLPELQPEPTQRAQVADLVPRPEPPQQPPPAIPPQPAAIPPQPMETQAPMPDSGQVALHLAQKLPPPAPAQTDFGPAPTFVEKWREPLPPGPPAAGNGEVPANPFAEVSDGAIEYFVEWSLEQSIGPRADPTSSFADVPMMLPGKTMLRPMPAPLPAAVPTAKRIVIPAATFAAGVVVGALVVALVRPSSPKPVAVATAAEPVAAAPAPSAASAPSAAPTPTAVAAVAPAPKGEPAAEVELSIATRPPGASLTVDGRPAGESPATVRVAAGKHEIAASKERYETAIGTVDAPGSVRLTLERPIARLRVSSTPAGAPVLVAGVARGKTPIEVRLPAYESYDVRVELTGNQPWRKSIYLKGPATTVEAQLIALRAPPKPVKPAAKR